MKKITIYILLCILGLNACSDKIDYLKEFTNGDERRYAGKVDDLVYFAGKDRLALQYVLSSDPDVYKTVIYWNLKKDSVEIFLDQITMKDDTVFYVLENMPENIYSFELYNYDRSGNKSVPVYISAKSYGAKFKSSLYEREVDKSVGKDGFSLVDGIVRLSFLDSLITSATLRIDYIDNLEGKQFVSVKNADEYAVLKDIKPLSEIKITTYHVPEAGAIDSFTVESKMTLPEFVKVDVPKPYAGAFVEGFDTPLSNSNWGNLWDGCWGKTYAGGNPEWDYTWAGEANWADFTTNPDNSYVGPTWMTFDMKRSGILSKFWLQSYWPFWSECPKVFEIWAFTGEGAPTAADGWNNWVKIAGFDTSDWTEAKKIEEFKKGYSVEFEYGEVPVARYFRVKNLKNYNYNESNAPDQQYKAYKFGLSEIGFSVYDFK